jgi:hypothetical protein
VSHLRPAARQPPRAADQVEARVLGVDRDGPLVDWGGRLGAVRYSWSEVGAQLVGAGWRVASGERVRAASEGAEGRSAAWLC